MATALGARSSRLGARTASRHTSARGRRSCVKVVNYTGDPLQLLKKIKPKLFINGEFVDSAGGKTFPLIDPRTGSELISLAEADETDADRAVRAARKAFDEGPWPRMDACERGKLLLKLADLVDQNTEELAALESLNNGKPFTVAKTKDVPGVSAHFRYFGGWADKIHGVTIPVAGPYWAYTLREPLGVVAQIIPWNFPLLMAAWKLGPALACGNTVVLKVAEQTPLTALKLAELITEAGFPPGVVNIIPGPGSTVGSALAQSNMVDKVAFTGSTSVGRIIGRQAAENLKPCTLELGGKSPVIIGPGANLDKVVATAHDALHFNQGQNCCAGSRTFVHESLYDEFVEKSIKAAKSRIVGDPFSEDTVQGPQVDAKQLDKILGYIEKGKAEGASLATGGKRIGDKGYYVEPTLFADVTNDMTIAREEIFGPVQSVLKWKTADEVVKMANDTPYGLAAGVFTQDADLLNTMTRNIKAGTVWANCYNVFDAAVPFGGYKDSGMGREKGEEALHTYSQVKSIYQPLENSCWK